MRFANTNRSGECQQADVFTLEQRARLCKLMFAANRRRGSQAEIRQLPVSRYDSRATRCCPGQRGPVSGVKSERVAEQLQCVASRRLAHATLERTDSLAAQASPLGKVGLREPSRQAIATNQVGERFAQPAQHRPAGVTGRSFPTEVLHGVAQIRTLESVVDGSAQR